MGLNNLKYDVKKTTTDKDFEDAVAGLLKEKEDSHVG